MVNWSSCTCLPCRNLDYWKWNDLLETQAKPVGHLILQSIITWGLWYLFIINNKYNGSVYQTTLFDETWILLSRESMKFIKRDKQEGVQEATKRQHTKLHHSKLSRFVSGGEWPPVFRWSPNTIGYISQQSNDWHVLWECNHSVAGFSLNRSSVPASDCPEVCLHWYSSSAIKRRKTYCSALDAVESFLRLLETQTGKLFELSYFTFFTPLHGNRTSVLCRLTPFNRELSVALFELLSFVLALFNWTALCIWK